MPSFSYNNFISAVRYSVSLSIRTWNTLVSFPDSVRASFNTKLKQICTSLLSAIGYVHAYREKSSKNTTIYRDPLRNVGGLKGPSTLVWINQSGASYRHRSVLHKFLHNLASLQISQTNIFRPNLIFFKSGIISLARSRYPREMCDSRTCHNIPQFFNWVF